MIGCAIRSAMAGLLALLGLITCGLPPLQSQETMKSGIAASEVESRHVKFADQLRIPTLITIAAKEELMDNKLHGERVYNRVKGNIPSKLEVFLGTHFEIYREGRMPSIKMTLEWFDKHL